MHPAARLTLVALLGLSACAPAVRQAPPPTLPPGAPVVEVEMEPIKIQATPGAAGLQIESFDAQELFEHAGAALSQKRYDDAIKLYDKLIANFPESPYVRPAFYNRGLAWRDKREWATAIESFKGLAERWPDHADAKDALFQMGACFAELENWPTSAEVFARLLDRKDLNADDRVEAMARRGFAQFNLNDLDLAEKTFRNVFYYKARIEQEERLATDFYLAFSQYHIGQISHRRFRDAPIRLPETQMDRDIEEKARLLLEAQRAYIQTIKYGNPAWASAAGFQTGSLYEELYDAFIKAPVPAELKGEAREVYLEELHKKIRILLEKALRWQRENLLMIERLGVDTDWAAKSRLAYGKLLNLLDPSGSSGLGLPPPATPPGPGTAVPPTGAPPAPPPPPRRDAPPPGEGPGQPGKPSAGDAKRQIL